MNIQKIAQLAGVSPATVSRVFSHHTSVSEEVRQKVLDVARKHNYIPHLTPRQKNIVILTPYNSVYPVQSCVDMLLLALTQHLPEYGFRMEILPVNSQERLDHIPFCGAVAIGCEVTDFPDWSERFQAPLIILDRPATAKKQENVYFIHSDEASGMELAIVHLAERGRKKIGCIIHGTPDRGNALIRCNAIMESLQKHKLPSNPQLIAYSGDGTEKYIELIGKMLNRGVDALFCPGGNAGILAVYALSLFGRSIPDDIALIASELANYSQFAVPPQTSITPDYHGLAKEVGQLFDDWLNNRKVRHDITLPYSLIERETV